MKRFGGGIALPDLLVAIIAIAAVLATTATANAIHLRCDAPIDSFGPSDPGKDPVKTVDIERDGPNAQWAILYYTESGNIINRRSQYYIETVAYGATSYWRGVLKIKGRFDVPPSARRPRVALGIVPGGDTKQGNSAPFPSRPSRKPSYPSLSGAKFDRSPFPRTAPNPRASAMARNVFASLFWISAMIGRTFAAWRSALPLRAVAPASRGQICQARSRRSRT